MFLYFMYRVFLSGDFVSLLNVQGVVARQILSQSAVWMASHISTTVQPCVGECNLFLSSKIEKLCYKTITLVSY